MQIQPGSSLPVSQSPLASQEAAIPASAHEAPTALPPDQLQQSPLPPGPRPAILNFSLLPDAAHYAQAVAKAQQRADQDLALQGPGRGDRLRQNYQSLFLAQPQPSPKGTVILFHGYTAGPWQYAEAAAKFHKAGYQVMVPRLPGHGFQTPQGTPTGKTMVDPRHVGEYERFIDETYAEAKALGGPVQVIGLSGGSNLALRMGEKYPDLKGVVAMAPYIGPSPAVRTTAAIVENVDRFSFLKLTRLLDMIPYNKNTRVQADHPMPHTQGTLGNAEAMLSVGTRVNQVKVPVQFFTTEGDALSGESAVEKLYTRSGGSERHAWFHFEAEDQVPHAMASPAQNNQPGRAENLWDMVFDFVKAGQGHTRLPRPEVPSKP
ncbi:MAG: alpha/beta hydrolase [Candidatus Sericytochromatia bacterium]